MMCTVILREHPTEIQQLCEYTTRRHYYNVRIPYSKTDSHLHSFFASSVRLWDDNIKPAAPDITLLEAFKQQLGGWAASYSHSPHHVIFY